MTASTSTDLVAWLREQIAEDERVAQAARKFGPVWSADPSGYVRFYDEDDAHLYSVEWPERAAHIALHDPATVLAQCEAHTLVLAFARGLLLMGESDEVGASVPPASARVAELLLKGLAVAYQHRPGYQQEWRPQS